MNLKTWIPVIAAVVLGGVAAKIARDSLGRGRSSSAPEVKVVKVVTVKIGVSPGQEITLENLALSPIVGQVPPPNTFMEVSAVAGRIASSPLFPGQTIYDGELAPRGAARGLSAMVPPGMRAITIDVNETSSLAGMLAPGCHVDALAIIPNGEAKATSAQMVVQNVLVQAVGQKLSNARPAEEGDSKKETRNDNYRSVTLIVTPREAQSLQLASVNTRMTLVLRGAGDVAASDEGSVTIADLLGSAQAAPPTPAPQIQPAAAIVPVAEVPRRYVELIKGTNAPVRVEFREAPHALPMNAATDIAPATEIENDGTQQ